MSHLIRTLNILVNDLLDSDRYFYVALDPYFEYLSHWWTVTFMSHLIRILTGLVTNLLTDSFADRDVALQLTEKTTRQLTNWPLHWPAH